MEKDKEKILSTRDLVLTALMIALVFLAGSVIRIPSVGGFVHIGDCMVFLSVIVLGKKKGTLASAFGMLIVDVFAGYYLWAPFTFIIKGIMAYITGAIIETFNKGEEYTCLKKEHIIAFIGGSIFMVVAYFIAGAIISGFFTGSIGLIQGFVYSAKDIVTNIIQVVTGVVLAIPLSGVVLSARKRVFN